MLKINPTEGKYFGTVQFYAQRDGRAFGFLFEDTTGDVVTFDVKAYRPLVIGEHRRPVFAEEQAIAVMRLPQKGDVLIFSKVASAGRVRVRHWSFLQEYDDLANTLGIMGIKEPDRYRVCLKCDFDDTPTILFEGSLRELVLKYPSPAEEGRHDRLTREESCDMFTVRRWFERLDADGSWEECPDPRIKIDAMTLRRIALANLES